MKKIVVICVLVLFPAALRAEGMVHKCQDAQGKMIYQASPCARSDVSVSTWSARAAVVPDKAEGNEQSSNRALVLKQQGNHYFVNGAVNGKGLTFVVDTGASVISLPRNFAYSANMSCQEQVKMQTANGASTGCTGIIARLKIGHFLLKDVPAMIAPNLNQPLLGMNVLQQFRIEQDNGEMRLIPRN